MSEFRFTYPRFVASVGMWLVNCQLWSAGRIVAEARHWANNESAAWRVWAVLQSGHARSPICP
jgi:hypothetical protein